MNSENSLLRTLIDEGLVSFVGQKDAPDLEQRLYAIASDWRFACTHKQAVDVEVFRTKAPGPRKNELLGFHGTQHVSDVIADGFDLTKCSRVIDGRPGCHVATAINVAHRYAGWEPVHETNAGNRKRQVARHSRRFYVLLVAFPVPMNNARCGGPTREITRIVPHNNLASRDGAIFCTQQPRILGGISYRVEPTLGFNAFKSDETLGRGNRRRNVLRVNTTEMPGEHGFDRA